MPEDVQNNNVFGIPNVVIALLDWGLGHTTRSIPIIRVLKDAGYCITIACNPSQKALLISEFPSVNYLSLDGYGLRYSNSSLLTRLAIAFQAPKILTNINRERKWIHGYVKKNKPDLIISDNRYGFRHRSVPSVIITHQLQVKTGCGRFIDKILNRQIRKWIEGFSACWVPDSPKEPSLAGELSHPSHPPVLKTNYLGPLSRLKACNHAGKQRFILIILSGPEPQRTILERILLRQAASLQRNFVFVRGLTNTRSNLSSFPHIKTFDHLPADKLNELLCSAELVISRAGYTSIMDYAKLGIRSVLIPTPGQAEQEYLARYLSQQKFVITCSQQNIDLEKLIESSNTFEFRPMNIDMSLYKEEIIKSLQSLNLPAASHTIAG